MSYYIESRGQDETKLSKLDEILLSRKPATSHDEQRLLTAHDAIELCRTMSLKELPDSEKISEGSHSLPKLLLFGVSVSITPTNIIRMRQEGKKGSILGLIKPYLGKSQPLSTGTASLHGALLHWYVEENLQSSGEARPDLCFIIDIFEQKIFSAPSHYSQRRKLLAASCQEIADRWNSIRSRLMDKEAGSKERKRPGGK